MKEHIKSPYIGKINEMQANEVIGDFVEHAKENAPKAPRKAILIRKDGFKMEAFFDGLPPTYKVPKKRGVEVFITSTDITPTVSQDFYEFYRADFNEEVKIYKEL